MTKTVLQTTLLLLFICSFSAAYAQKYSEAIEDNSYFVEEAYNQEYRVVQHIFNAYHFSKPEKEQGLAFTQEWPIFGQAHQLSYTIPYNGTSFTSGIGDMLINYRYQLTGHDDFITSSPRISIILPTGDRSKGFGNAKFGVQFNLPFSKRLSEAFVAHLNLGYSIIPNVERYYGVTIPEFDFPADNKANLQQYSAGASLIWLASYNLNFMLEYLVTSSNDFLPAGGTEFSTEHIINPGLRFAIDIGELQVVPGISVPIRIDKDITTAGVFTYLSFEHPF